AVAAERVERLQRLAVEDPQPRRAAARHIEELLLRIVGEGGARDGLAVAAVRRLAIAVDEALHHELAVEREHLHALAAAIGHIDEPVVRYPRGVNRLHELQQPWSG